MNLSFGFLFISRLLIATLALFLYLPAIAVESLAMEAKKAVQREYQLTVAQRAAQLKRYPRDASEKGWEGSSTVRALIGPEGKLETVELEVSAGHEVLDNQAKETLKAAIATVPAPEALSGERFEVRLRLVFALPPSIDRQAILSMPVTAEDFIPSLMGRWRTVNMRVFNADGASREQPGGTCVMSFADEILFIDCGSKADPVRIGYSYKADGVNQIRTVMVRHDKVPRLVGTHGQAEFHVREGRDLYFIAYAEDSDGLRGRIMAISLLERVNE